MILVHSSRRADFNSKIIRSTYCSSNLRRRPDLPSYNKYQNLISTSLNNKSTILKEYIPIYMLTYSMVGNDGYNRTALFELNKLHSDLGFFYINENMKFNNEQKRVKYATSKKGILTALNSINLNHGIRYDYGKEEHYITLGGAFYKENNNHDDNNDDINVIPYMLLVCKDKNLVFNNKLISKSSHITIANDPELHTYFSDNSYIAENYLLVVKRGLTKPQERIVDMYYEYLNVPKLNTVLTHDVVEYLGYHKSEILHYNDPIKIIDICKNPIKLLVG